MMNQETKLNITVQAAGQTTHSATVATGVLHTVMQSQKSAAHT